MITLLPNCLFSFQVFIPNEVELFGNANLHLTRGTSVCGFYMFNYNINIAKSHVKALDQHSSRCTSDTNTPNTTVCLASYIEKQIGCSPNIQGSQFPEGISCNNKSHLDGLANITKLFQTADENDIFALTGCLSACEKDKFTLSVDPVEKVAKTHGGDCEFHISFKIMKRSYGEEEQYVIYDTDSFFADVGGYMGLLLGCSLMSLYNELEALLKRLLCRSEVKK